MDILSQSSTVSTIPPDIIYNQDEDFLDEIERVNDLYFGNLQVAEDSDAAIARDASGSDDDSDNDQEYGVAIESVVQTELRDTDLSEQSLQSDFQNKTCGCVRLYGKP